MSAESQNGNLCRRTEFYTSAESQNGNRCLRIRIKFSSVIKFLKQHPDIKSGQTDKSKAATLIYKQDYLDRVKHHLSDTTTYQPIQTSSIAGYITVNRKLLEILKQKGFIKEQQKQDALKTETKISNMYGLTKDHKPDQKIRPICNTRGTPSYFIAKTLNEILTGKLDKSTYDIKKKLGGT